MRLFGTDGIRGEVGKYPLTPENVLKLAKASSLVLRKKNSISRVVINKDTRLSGYIFEPALTSGFLSMGIEVILVGPLHLLQKIKIFLFQINNKSNIKYFK